MNIIVVEDSHVNRLAPATTARPAWSVTCGGYRLFDFLQRLDGKLFLHTRPMLVEITAHDFPDCDGQLSADEEMTLVVNGRLAPTVKNFSLLQEAIALHAQGADKPVAVAGQSANAIVILPTSKLLELVSATGSDAKSCAASLMAKDAAIDFQTVDADFFMLDWPHDIIAAQMQCCGENIEFRLMGGGYQRLADEFYLSAKSPSKIPESTVFDTSDGPVVIESGCTIGPFSYFRGPVYIGPNSKISEHSSIKDSVSIGHTCKIGGEVEGVIVEPFSNKQHYGFLGHSYLGSWVNLGAGTCNSDLKNTYGKVNMTSFADENVSAEKIATGMQFVGCVVGDYAKTAINTSIFTGKLIGVGSTVYGMATTNVPSFVNYARSIGQIGLLPPEVVVTTQLRMFGRRKVQQRPCDAELIGEMFRQTQSQRPEGLTAEPLKF